MSAGDGSIPDIFKVDFTQYNKNMTVHAFMRLLSQFKSSSVLKQFLTSFVQNGPQWTYDEIIKTQEVNTLYMAQGTNLEAIGRIAGQKRTLFYHDESTWFSFDRRGQGFDQALAWVQGAEIEGNIIAPDNPYRRMILAKIVCNFNRFSSYPEMAYQAKFVTGETVSWIRVGPMECIILIRAEASTASYEIITGRRSTPDADDVWNLPYPATLNLTRIIYIPDKAFWFDRAEEHQFDVGQYAVGKTI